MMWLSLAVLPVQSWAVATMVNCGPLHHRITLQTVDATPDVHHGHAHEGHDQAGHDQGAHHHDMATVGHADQDQADDDTPVVAGSILVEMPLANARRLAQELPGWRYTSDHKVTRLLEAEAVRWRAGLGACPKESGLDALELAT